MARVMLDLETLGTDPGCVILSIGAVRFTTQGVKDDGFYEVINIESAQDAGLRIEAGTLSWWLDQDPKAQQVLQAEGRSLAKVLDDFRVWYGQADEVWANAPTFDCMILRSAYDAVGGDVPWEYWDERCHRTLKALPVAASFRRGGVHHNALDDARHQARVAAETLQRIHNGEYR